MINSFEIKTNKIDFKYIWKIEQIKLDNITFSKYGIKKQKSLNNFDNETTVLIENFMGFETYKATQDVILELSSKVGELIKEFKVQKSGKDIKVNKIIWI